MKLIINLKKPIFDNNKIIKFETKYIYEINIINDIIIGGDIFDDINIDDIIIKKDEEPIKIITDSKKNIGEIDSKILKKHNIVVNKKNNITTFKMSKLKFSMLNSIYDIKLLLYYLLNIPIENQNLLEKDNSTLFYNYTNNITNEILDINIQNIINIPNIKYFQNIPIDLDLINNRINYTLYTYERNKYIEDLKNIVNKDLIHLDLIILDDIILDKSSLYNEIEKDNELKSIIYKGFIEKYFPYYDTNLFSLYLLNENKTLEYPSLNIKSDSIIYKNDKLSDIVHKNFKQLDKSLTTHYKKLTYHIPSFNTVKTINLRELFNNIVLKKIRNLKKIELQLEIQNKIIYFSKQNIYTNNKLNETFDEEDSLYKNLHINNKYYNSLVDSIYLNNNIILLIYTIFDKNTNSDKEIYIIIDEFFDIYVIYNLSEFSKYTDSKNIIETNLHYYETNILNALNNLFSDLFQLKIIQNKKVITKTNIELKLMDKQIIINQNISINTFQKLYSLITNLNVLDYYNISNYDEINNIIELNIKKIKYNSIFNKSLTLLSNNYYNFYTKYDLIEKYNKILYSSNIIFSNRIKDIKIDILNTNKDDVNEILYIIKYILNEILESNKNTSNADSNSKLISKNKLKKLKEIDPVLYAINKKNTNNLYSRKCQANQQPDIIDEKEAKKTKNHIKYINFTTGEPIYYTCNNKKFPNVKFLTNLHPQNFCIPCCKKKAIEDVKIKSKYISIHNECLTTYKYDKKNKLIDEKSRYIMNYSSKTIIENLRLMQIPDSLFKLFNKTFEDLNSNQDLKYYILGLNQNVGNISYVGWLSVISFILNKSINETINFIKNLFIKDPDFIHFIYNGKLLTYFASTKDFLIVFTNIFQDKILLSNINFEFNEWNDLFIDICKYLGYIGIIFEEQDTNDETNLNLVIPPNIKYVNEYIFNNDSFQYILILKRIYKNKLLYYPIIKTNYADYYNENRFYNKVFTYDNQIIKLVSEIIKNKLTKTHNSLSLTIIEQFIIESASYNIETYFINNKYEIYSILISNAVNVKSKEYIYINIKKQKILNDDYNINTKINKNYSSQYINLNEYKIQLNEIITFIHKFNKFIYSKNKEYYTDLYYKSYLNTPNNTPEYLTLSNDVIDKLYSYVYISNFLIYNNKIIGLQLSINSKNYNGYISKPIEKDIGKKLISNKSKEIKKILENNKLKKEDISKLLIREFQLNTYSEINYLYNPHEVNNIIYSKKIIEDNRILKLNESIYYTNLYNLFLIHFTNKLYKLKNIIIRSKLKHLINNLNHKDINLIVSNQYLKIKELIDKYITIDDDSLKYKILYNLSDFIKNVIIKNLSQKITSKWLIQIKKNIIENLDNSIFLFDNILIYNILNLEKKDAIKELDKIFSDIIINTNLPSNNSATTLSLELCDVMHDSYICKNNKLIISKDIYNKFIDILYYDLTNPFKQKLILNLVNYNLNNIYQFKQFINEKIYIYI